MKIIKIKIKIKVLRHNPRMENNQNYHDFRFSLMIKSLNYACNSIMWVTWFIKIFGDSNIY